MLDTLFGSKIDLAIERIKYFEAQALSMSPDGYYVAFSGGKDSIVLLDLIRRSGVKHKAHFNLTTVDPPELIYFIRKYYPDVITHKPLRSMWQLFRDKRMPPTRIVRYCCQVLKEGGGSDCLVVTGIRWQESVKRSRRRMTETCNRVATKVYLHPIIDWESSDVWEYIRRNNLPYPSLYDEGWKRIGCIGCPMGGKKGMRRDFTRWPKYYDAYLRAAKESVKNLLTPGKEYSKRKLEWKTGEEMMSWWLQDDDKDYPDENIGLFENAGGDE